MRSKVKQSNQKAKSGLETLGKMKGNVESKGL